MPPLPETDHDLYERVPLPTNKLTTVVLTDNPLYEGIQQRPLPSPTGKFNPHKPLPTRPTVGNGFRNLMDEIVYRARKIRTASRRSSSSSSNGTNSTGGGSITE